MVPETRVEEELARYQPEKDMVLTIGVFDGVHLGHRHLLAELLRQAEERSLLSGVITFRYQPQKMLIRQSKLPFLTDLEERKRLLNKVGVNAIIPVSFTAELVLLRAREFVDLLYHHLRMRGLVVGPDFALGRDREGNIDFLTCLGREMGFTADRVELAGPMQGFFEVNDAWHQLFIRGYGDIRLLVAQADRGRLQPVHSPVRLSG